MFPSFLKKNYEPLNYIEKLLDYIVKTYYLRVDRYMDM